MKYVRRYWFGLVILALCLTPLIWFWGKGDILINGLDTNFPLNPLVWFKRRFFVWYDVANAGSDFSSSVSGLFFHLIQVVPYLLGLKLRAVEIISLTIWFSLVVVSSLIFIKSTGVKNKIAQLIFVLVYSFNIYLFNTWENIKVSNLAVYIGLPLFCSLLNFFRKGSLNLSKFFAISLLVSIIAGGSGINPAYFIALLGGIFIYGFVVALAKREERKLLVRGLLVVLGSLFLVNLFWILPLFNYLFFQIKIGSLADIGLTNWLDSLSVNTNLLNVFRLQGAWDWYSLDEYGMPMYLPYTLNYLRRLPFILFSFVLPTIAIFAFIFQKGKENKELYLSFAAFLLLGVFLGAGTRDPTGVIYKFLVQKIPFFSFFRSPWYIFTPYLTFAYAGLASLFFANLKKGQLPLFILFTAGYFLYSYPQITGKIFRPSRPDGFYVKFPDYVWQTEKWLTDEETGINARIITYPDDQLESFDWGYRGTDTILSLFSTREFITPSFNLASDSLKNLLAEFYSSLKKKNYNSAFSLMKFLGADTIFNRRDFISLSPKIDESDPEISAQVTKKEIGNWSFLQVGQNRGVEKLYFPETVLLNYSSDQVTVGMTKLAGQKKLMSVKLPDTEFLKTLEIEKDGFFAVQEAENRSIEKKPAEGVQDFILDIPQAGTYKLFLPKRGSGSVDYELGGSLLMVDSVTTLVGSQYSDNPEFYVFGPVSLNKGLHQIEVRFPVSENLLEIEDVTRFSDYGSLRSEELPSDKSKTLVAFSADENEKRISIPVKNFDPFRRYLLSFDYKYFYGKVPIIDIVQSTPSAPVKTFPDYMGSSFDWEKKTVTINPVELESKLDFFLILPKNIKRERSKTFIENLSFLPIMDYQLFALQEEAFSYKRKIPDQISFQKESPVEYHLEVKGGQEDYYIVFLENYSPGWTLTSKDISGKPLHFTANGYANGWYIPGGKDSQKIVIYYSPQKYLISGFIIFGLTLTAAIYLFLKKNV